ncbi:SDR family NAD(P)-dependent oxidoreductase [Craterilacuibacter sp.]|uniref:SDR family NAD(P)-dependent oxidoreductase n=1 Tax=Craterilacuibacter sp. TaxID=2870909 RepID=UPI003F336B76
MLLTGASRGLGAALARALASANTDLICIARHSDDTLALPTGARLIWIEADLTDSALLELVAERALAALGHGPFASLTLINNAGMVAPMAPCGRYPAAEVATALALNTLAPMLLSNAFLAWAAGKSKDVRLLNISSGAAVSAIPGWSVYGASKAAIDQFSRCVAAEQGLLADGARVAALYPGVIDTDMQGDIRASDADDFPNRARFDALKAEGGLSSPGNAAARITAYLNSAAFGREPVADIRKI